MNILVRLTVPNHIYKFYTNAAKHIANSTTEDIMADVLSAYAGLISKEIAKENENTASASPEPLETR